jgi:hypothetical protein
MFAEIRLIGEDPDNTIVVDIYNDTGSNAQTIYNSNFQAFAPLTPQTYSEYQGLRNVATANGVVQLPTFIMEMRIVRANETPISG